MKARRLTRKEIAGLVGVSTDSVRRNEDLWGLTKAKVKANARLVWYNETQALEELKDRHLLE